MSEHAKISAEKHAIVAALKEELAGAKGAVFTGYQGLNVATDTQLRRALREAGVRYHVVKNTLASIAAREAGLDALADHFKGTTALASSATDAVAPAKVISEFLKKNKLADKGILTMKAGLVEGKVIDEAGVQALAALPPREVLIAKVLGTMQAPIAGTVGVLGGLLGKAVRCLDAIREQKEKASA